MKEKILNGTFTPNIHNSRTHWQSIFNGKKYRSSWEAVFHSLNLNLVYEKHRIKYLFDGKESVYIVDFSDLKNNILFEIKPKSCIDKKTKTKELFAKQWCKENDYEYVYITEEYFYDNYDKINFNNFSKDVKDKMEKMINAYKKNKKN